MAVAYFVEVDGVGSDVAEQLAEQVNQRVGPDGPEGGIYHAEGPLDNGGQWVFDVWETAELADRFYRETLAPVMQELGIDAAQFQPRQMAVRWETNNPQ